MKMKRVRPTAAAEADEDAVTLADNSSLQIASLAEPKSEAAVGGDSITTLEDALAKTDVVGPG